MPVTTYPLTGQSIAYVLTMVDHATNFPVLCPVADTTARATTSLFLDSSLWNPSIYSVIWFFVHFETDA